MWWIFTIYCINEILVFVYILYFLHPSNRKRVGEVFIKKLWFSSLPLLIWIPILILFFLVISPETQSFFNYFLEFDTEHILSVSSILLIIYSIFLMLCTHCLFKGMLILNHTKISSQDEKTSEASKMAETKRREDLK
jgi:lysylphosphatidylglycerol synthetase-like protein (DUF2156 family)